MSSATVTIPASYYASNTSKSVTTMTLPTSATSSATANYTLKATINRNTSDQYINIAPGYNSAGGYYKISAIPNGTATAPSSISGTSATVSTGTNTITLTKSVSVTPSITTEWIDQKNQEYRHSTELHFSKWFKKHEDFWNSVPINDKMMISNQVRSRNVMEGMRMEAITIDNWLKYIKELKETKK